MGRNKRFNSLEIHTDMTSRLASSGVVKQMIFIKDHVIMNLTSVIRSHLQSAY